MNQVTPVTQEAPAPVMFGHVKSQIYMDIYNTCISYPTATILLGLADVNTCFRYPIIHTDITGAFDFIADDLYNLAMAMVIGLTASASSWEAFRQAIKALTNVFANRPDLVIRHKKFIDMLKWEVIDPSTELTPAFSCTINRGIIDDAGNQIDLPAYVYVNNALMLPLDVNHMKMVLATMIEGIIVVMGEPNVAVRQCPLAMGKWLELVIGPKQTMLGLIINTNRLTIAIPAKYLQEVFDLLYSTWHPNRCCFKVSEAQKLTGKLACLAKEANWVFHFLSHLYLSIAYALSGNKRLLTESSKKFCNIVLAICTGAFVTPCKDLARHTSYAMKRVAKLTHHVSYQYNINKTMRYKIEFFCDKLKPDLGIEWETPIAHLIPQTPFAMTIGDSLLEGAGGFLITLGFWWHICFPDEVVQRTLQFRSNNNGGMLVLINVLKFVTVIINYCAALRVVQTSSVTDDPHPAIVNITNNSSALSWTLHMCKQSKIRQMLSCFVCSLLINLPLGINDQYN
jgi:hypothetical protein